MAAVAVGLAFAPQAWASSHGYFQKRTLEGFAELGASWWSYGAPSTSHRWSGLAAGDPYAGENAVEKCSYLGVVTLGLLGLAAIGRVRFEGRGYWWISLVLLAVLSLGADVAVGTTKIPMPGLWLKKYLPLFGPIRAPARFNLLVAVFAAVIAAASLARWTGRWRGRGLRVAAVGALGVVAVADLAVIGTNATLPAAPGAYAFIRRQNPAAAVLEVPQSNSVGSGGLPMLCSYWQTSHRLKINAGCCANPNRIQDTKLTWASPFLYLAMSNPAYLSEGAAPPGDFNVVGGVGFDEYAWLYLSAHEFDYVVVHHDPKLPLSADPGAIGRLRERLATSAVFGDEKATVYDVRRLPAPTGPAVLPTDGWRFSWDDKCTRAVGRRADLMVYQPEGAGPCRVSLEVRAFHEPRKARLRWKGGVLAEWDVPAGGFGEVRTGAIELPPGRHELWLETDGESAPRDAGEHASQWDDEPYAIRVRRLDLERLPVMADGAARPPR